MSALSTSSKYTSKEAESFSVDATNAVTNSVEQFMNLAAGKNGVAIPDDVKRFVNDTVKNTKADTQGDMGFVIIKMDDKDARKLLEKYQKQLNKMGGGF